MTDKLTRQLQRLALLLLITLCTLSAALELSGAHPLAGVTPNEPKPALATPAGPGAAAQPWTQIGDAGGAAVQALALDLASPGRIYAGTCDSGMFVTANSGVSWSNPLTACVAAIAPDPQVTTTVYAGTFFGGAYRSAASGASWSPVNNGLTADHVTALAATAGAPATLYAGTETGVYSSTTRGDAWFPAGAGMSGDNVQALLSAGGVLFAGTEQGVFRSTNGGLSWAAANQGLAANDVRSLAGSGATAYAGTERGVFRSTNGAATWVKMSMGLPDTPVETLVVVPGAAHVVFAGTAQGVYGSAGSGNAWVNLSANLSGWALVANALAVKGGPGSWTLYAGTGSGVWTRTVTEDQLVQRIWLPLIQSVAEPHN